MKKVIFAVLAAASLTSVVAPAANAGNEWNDFWYCNQLALDMFPERAEYCKNNAFQ